MPVEEANRLTVCFRLFPERTNGQIIWKKMQEKSLINRHNPISRNNTQEGL